jgi:hypothetical protein
MKSCRISAVTLIKCSHAFPNSSEYFPRPHSSWKLRLPHNLMLLSATFPAHRMASGRAVSWLEPRMLPSETVAYHEGIPGHHMQVSIQQLTGLPEFRLYLINSSLCRRLGPLRGDVRQGDRIFPGPGLGLRTSLSGAPTGSSSRRRHRHSLARLDPRGGIG